MPDQLFQKVNFLRNISNAINHLNRIYFAILRAHQVFKVKIIQDFDTALGVALEGVTLLLNRSKYGVYEAHLYNGKLTTKIKCTPVGELLDEPTRIPNRVEILAFLFISPINFHWHRTQENRVLCHSI